MMKFYWIPIVALAGLTGCSNPLSRATAVLDQNQLSITVPLGEQAWGKTIHPKLPDQGICSAIMSIGLSWQSDRYMALLWMYPDNIENPSNNPDSPASITNPNPPHGNFVEVVKKLNVQWMDGPMFGAFSNDQYHLDQQQNLIIQEGFVLFDFVVRNRLQTISITIDTKEFGSKHAEIPIQYKVPVEKITPPMIIE